MLLKNLHWGSLLFLLPVLLLAEVVTWGFVLAREPRQWRDKPRAYAWIIRHWSEIMVKRRQVQAVRRCTDRDLLKQHSYRLDFEQTTGGWLPRAAHWIFDPLFFIFRQLALFLIWW
jgi:hypothetical protein